MGIRGLTTYIANQSDRYLKYYELHDCYLVIDGNSVACQIYTQCRRRNYIFGGDYDIFAQSVSDFFDDLLRCNVIPLVLFDGGCENRKLKTLITRMKDKIRIASISNPSTQKTNILFPIFHKIVFVRVLKDKGIRCAQCLFEADNTIATVARILNCPVLSYDSDFYIYGTQYIPFNTLHKHVVWKGRGYVKRCQIYMVEYLVNSIRGLDQALLPLAAVLLGNDYVEQRTFKNFYRHMKLPGAKMKKHNHQQCRIETTLKWLGRHTLDKAVIAVLSRTRKERRRKVLEMIESNINCYTNASSEILIPLGFSKKEVKRMKAHSTNRIFKFDGDIDSLTYIEETASDSSKSNDEEEEEKITEIFPEVAQDSTEASFNNLPAWFISEFQKLNFNTYLMDLLVLNLYLCPVQMEDDSSPSTILSSLKIISVIYGLLMSGVNEQRTSMKYVARGVGTKLARSTLQRVDTLSGLKFPSLYKLRDLPLSIRRTILRETLGVTESDPIDELPSEWMLYIATAKYWNNQQQDDLYKSKCYMYCLLFCMLFNVVDQHIGMYRDPHCFQNKYGQSISSLQQRRKKDGYRPYYSLNMTVSDALSKVDYEDCLLAAEYFITQFQICKKLYSMPKNFNKTIVHRFTTFQSCLRHSIDLNALLGYPYEECRVAALFNGTMLYNLYNKFKGYNDIETYIDTVLQNSPSLLQLFKVLLSKVKPMFPFLLVSKKNKYKKQQKHKPAKSEAGSSQDEYEDASECLETPTFCDPNNIFTMLGMHDDTCV